MSDTKHRKINVKSTYLAGLILSAVVLFYVVSTIQRQYRFREREPQNDSSSILPKILKFGGEKIPGEMFLGMETARFEKDHELIDEIKKIIAQKETPSEIFKNNVSDGINIATTLNHAFSAENPEELKILRDAAPKGNEWSLDKETLEKLGEILTRFEPKRLAIRQMLQQPKTCFYFIFNQDRETGETIDVQAADYLEDYLLLEEYAIAQSLWDGNMEDALDSLVYVFRMAQLAAEVGIPAVRSSAALIRLRAVDVMQAIVLHPKFSKRYLAGLYEMIREQLENWTPDRTVWVADRASGLKTYHRILQSGLEAALTPGEIKELEERGRLVFIPRKQKKRPNDSAASTTNTKEEEIKELVLLKENFFETHVADEIFYLKSMQKVIDECKKPFYQRLAVLTDINNDVLDRMNKETEPIIAVLLLRGIVPLMRLYAQDRAGCETAFLAMSVSLEKPEPATLITNPFSAEKYKVNRIQDEKNPNRQLVQVPSPDNRQPFRVPDYSNYSKSPPH
ncbi:MAG: hypothetical protein LBQ50_10395 [Planctomycetaceae bacterium]|jgi:hypothetical protein|nr:hypothetical protein [Planctomycetaceae bacterium]